MTALVYSGPHRLHLDAAPDAYEPFDAREDGATKVVLEGAT